MVFVTLKIVLPEGGSEGEHAWVLTKLEREFTPRRWFTRRISDDCLSVFCQSMADALGLFRFMTAMEEVSQDGTPNTSLGVVFLHERVDLSLMSSPKVKVLKPELQISFSFENGLTDDLMVLAGCHERVRVELAIGHTVLVTNPSIRRSTLFNVASIRRVYSETAIKQLGGTDWLFAPDEERVLAVIFYAQALTSLGRFKEANFLLEKEIRRAETGQLFWLALSLVKEQVRLQEYDCVSREVMKDFESTPVRVIARDSVLGEVICELVKACDELSDVTNLEQSLHPRP
ncbi:hypothetical protein HOI18_01030 [Candidatus Uhrbacteria bacterium]|nr:hypothetical protein [Candidatus Uhrbacteria bacterium]